jgi:hypothetical protein
MSLSEQLLEEYNEVFHRPNGSIRLLTKSQAQFIRAVMRCNEINMKYRTNDKRTINKEDNTT